MRDVVLVDGMRTGFAKIGSTIKHIPSSSLAAIVIDGLIEKTGVIERGGHVDGLYMGSAFCDSETQAMARYATLLSKHLDYSTWSSYVERQCGSAIDAINHAAAAIMVGNADIMIAGGADSHSRRVVKFSQMSLSPNRLDPPAFIPQKLSPVKEENISMIQVSDDIAKLCNITRQECDEFAFRSQRRAAAAAEKGYFKEEIVPIVIPAGRKTPEIVFTADEQLRPSTTMEGLAALKPVYPDGVTTAGNASTLNDGAAMVLMMTGERAKELGYEPFARYIMAGDAALNPALMGLGPVEASLKALKRAGLTVDDIDVWECNEAFAAQNLGVIRKLEEQSGKKIDMEKWNPNGGAIAFGHPNGASGARVGIFTMKELARRGGRYGLFTSCCGGGQGVTAIIENLRR